MDSDGHGADGEAPVRREPLDYNSLQMTQVAVGAVHPRLNSIG